MRWTPNAHGIKTMQPGHRPPAAALPVKVRAAVEELDRLTAALDTAERHREHLADRMRDEEAHRADEIAAAEAIRAGEPLPATDAAATLAADRETAERTVAATRRALAAAEADVSAVCNEAHAAAVAKASKQTAAARELVAAKVAELADAIEQATADAAVTQWLGGGPYFPGCEISALDAFPDLARRGLPRNIAPHGNARAVIGRIAATILETE